MKKSKKKSASGKSGKKNQPQEEPRKIIATNRSARFKYEILETFQAGIALQGTEVKALRGGKCNLTDSYAACTDGELFLLNCHVGHYDAANRFNHAHMRKRKLLLHRREINRLIGKMSERGLTLIPLQVYFLDSRIKVDLGLAKGKSHYDKRETIKRRDQERDAAREMAGRG